MCRSSASRSAGRGTRSSYRLVPGGRHFGQRLEFVRLAQHEQPRHVDVADVGAALGLVHVVRGDEQRHAAGGQLEQQVPQLPPGDGVDAGRRLVEKQQFGLVNQRTRQRQPLLPAAGERAGELIDAVAECR